MSIDPATMMIGSAVLSGAGSLFDSGMSSQRTSAINSGRNQLMQREIGRQNQLSSEAWPIFQQTADKQGADASAGRLQKYVDQRVADTSGPIVSPVKVGNVPSQVNNEIARTAHNVGEVVARNAKAKAQLEGYGDVTADNSVDNTRTGTRLNTISNFAKGSEAVLPAEFQSSDYNAAMSNQSPLGQILKLLGGGMGLYGAFSPAGAGGIAGTGITPGTMGSGGGFNGGMPIFGR